MKSKNKANITGFKAMNQSISIMPIKSEGIANIKSCYIQ